LLVGAGRPISDAIRSRLQSDDATLHLEAGALRVAAKSSAAREFSVRLAQVPVADAGDLVITLTARAAPMAGAPPEIARLVHAALAPSGQDRKSVMSWMTTDAFTSRFYFRNVPAGQTDIVFTFESGAPVWISELSAYAAPDRMAREFTRGLVLANPSDRPQSFDLATIAPGRKFRRLRATPNQDTAINNGEPARQSLVLPPRDALFLIRD
jgi:hypothetical protein